jgi:hypothetical protein
VTQEMLFQSYGTACSRVSAKLTKLFFNILKNKQKTQEQNGKYM